MMSAFKDANTVVARVKRRPCLKPVSCSPMYVPQLILLNEGPVTMTTTKLNVQFDAVLNAFAGARIRKPTISAGYSK